jgi:hypothetical protein
LHRRRQNHKAFGKATIGGLLIALILLLNAMAVCPALHELIHKDASNSDHECAVTIFACGTVESATVDVPVSLVPALIEATPKIEFFNYSTAVETLPQGRAPPALPAVS